MKDFFSKFKQELITIPIVLLAFYLLNFILGWLFPNSAFFDFFSQVENIVFGTVKFFVVIALGWFGVRVMLPSVFRFIKDEFYDNFGKQALELKYILSTIFIIGFLIVASLSVNGQNFPSEKTSNQLRMELVQNLIGQLDVREVTPNSSPMIDKYNAYCGFNYAVPWCASSASYNYGLIGLKYPRSAWSPDFAKEKDRIWTMKQGFKKGYRYFKPGDAVTFYYDRLKRVGHVGILIKQDKSGYFVTIEGNTNRTGSREGDGMYMKKRNPNKVFAVTRYIL